MSASPLDMIRGRTAELALQAEALLELEQAGEGSSTARELDLLLAEAEFLASLGRRLAVTESIL